MVNSNTAVYVGGEGEGWNECDKSGHLSIFTLLKHLMMLLKCKFFRALYLHLIKDTDGTDAAQIFFKVETFLNNALNELKGFFLTDILLFQ